MKVLKLHWGSGEDWTGLFSVPPPRWMDGWMDGWRVCDILFDSVAGTWDTVIASGETQFTCRKEDTMDGRVH